MKGRKLKMSEIIEKSYKCEHIYIKSNQADREILVDISPKSLIDLIKDIEDEGEAYEYIDESKLDSIDLKCKIEQFAQEYDELDDIEIPHYETCRQCGNIFEEFELTCGLCFECYEENEDYEGEE